LLPNAELADRMLEEVGAGNLGVCVNASAVVAAGESFEAYADRFGDRLGFLQLSDCAVDDEQMALGDGDADLARLVRGIEAMAYDGSVALELLSEELAAEPERAYVRSLAYLETHHWKQVPS
jgi:sugar phosphate isomerase/epimerase